jgi:hypothetical protein
VWAVPSEQAVGQNLRQRRATKALTGLAAPTYAVLLRLFVWASGEVRPPRPHPERVLTGGHGTTMAPLASPAPAGRERQIPQSG